MREKGGSVTEHKRLLENGYKRAQEYAANKKALVQEVSKLMAGISSKIRKSSLGPNVSDLLRNIEGVETFSGYENFRANLNAFLGKMSIRGLSEKEADFLWMLHKKGFEGFDRHPLGRLQNLLQDEEDFVSESIDFLNRIYGGARPEVGSYIETTMPNMLALLNSVREQRKALSGGDIDGFIEHYEYQLKIDIRSYTLFSRRKFMIAAGATAAIAGTVALEYSNLGKIISSIGSSEQPPASKLEIKGVNYDVGTQYTYTFTTRGELNGDIMEQEIALIKDSLHCNAIRIYGWDLDLLVRASKIAIKHGLQVWFSPRLIHMPPEGLLKVIQKYAVEAENLRQTDPSIVFIIGNELTLDCPGFIEGETYQERGGNLSHGFRGDINKFKDFLRQLAGIVRSIFKGRVTYAAGSWERADWEIFDIVSRNLYLTKWNKSSYS
ncbi:hypothetical protein HYU10_00890 [Candidatus Woesearchaeota archaeon]|nr:hypothetical protein [Candidatus Woesearchaeota archaeon]MBI2130305.1 hypothetical protein [Candidatus Woesearchaeota archaeon]